MTCTLAKVKPDYHAKNLGRSSNIAPNIIRIVFLGVLLLNLDECMEILAGACHLQMKSAISLCADFLETELCAKTCVDILNIAEMFAIVRVSETKQRKADIVTYYNQYAFSLEEDPITHIHYLLH